MASVELLSIPKRPAPRISWAGQALIAALEGANHAHSATAIHRQFRGNPSNRAGQGCKPAPWRSTPFALRALRLGVLFSLVSRPAMLGAGTPKPIPSAPDMPWINGSSRLMMLALQVLWSLSDHSIEQHWQPSIKPLALIWYRYRRRSTLGLVPHLAYASFTSRERRWCVRAPSIPRPRRTGGVNGSASQ